MSETIVNRECRFAVHIPVSANNPTDYHLIKEQLHVRLDDGSVVIRPQVRLIKEYKRKFWITKKEHRNHQQKKENELKTKCNEYKCTESDLYVSVSRALERSSPRRSLVDLASSPYLYGTSMPSVSLLKKEYQEKYPIDKPSKFTVAAMDTETTLANTVESRGLLMCSVCFDKYIHVAVLRGFVDKVNDPVATILDRTQKHLGDYLAKLNIPITNVLIDIVDTEYRVLKSCFDRLHEWQPDFVAIWNLDFDMSMILEVCKRAGISPADLMSDPSVPRAQRYFDYIRGPDKQITASGVLKPKDPWDRWHTVRSTSSFYFIDAMCVYRQLRLHEGQHPFGLDWVLHDKLGYGKLKIPEAEDLDGTEFHEHMQENYPAEYVVYNIVDSLRMLELDDKTKDLCMTVPNRAGVTDFARFPSVPTSFSDGMYALSATKGLVHGTCGRTMRTEIDAMTLSLDNWIVMLPSELYINKGSEFVTGLETMPNGIITNVADLDASAAYPNGVICYNISRRTTRRELCDVKGVTPEVFRMQGINLSSGHVNAIEYCVSMMGFPTLDELERLYMESKK